MKTFSVAASTLLLCALATAQGDTITMASGAVIDGCSVQSYTVQELKYTKGGKAESVSPDQVLKVELKKFKDVYRRSIANKDADLMLTEARNQFTKAKDELMAQVGYLECARLYSKGGNDGNAGGVIDELQKNIPNAGTIPDGFRLKFENYMGRGDAGGVNNAKLLAKKYSTEATTSAWPNGFAVEAEFFGALADAAGGGDAKAFQAKMRDIVSKSSGPYPHVAARANVQLAHSLRQTGGIEAAQDLYEQVLNGKAVDDSSRAGAYLGLGYLAMGRGDAANREPFHQALLSFLRVRVETKGAWESLQAEAMYNAMMSAEKWGGQDFRLIQARCRYVLLNNFGDSEWAARARGQ